jgi:MoxR-like ATPase
MPTPTQRRTTAKPKVIEHPLSHLVPDVRYASVQVKGGEYISRMIGGYVDIDVLRYAKRCEPSKNVRLYGPAGPGKTSMIQAYCATDQIPLVTVNANGGIDPNSFFGQWVPKHGVDASSILATMQDVRGTFPRGTSDDTILAVTMAIVGQEKFEYVYSDVVNIIRYGGMLFIDEANFMGGKVSSVFNPLADGRRFITILDNGNELIRAHPDLQLAIAYNPEYEGTRPLNEGFSDRFDIVVEVDYDHAVEEQLVYMPVLLTMADRLREAYKQGTIRTPVSTRKLMAFEEFCIDIDLDFAIDNFVAGFHADEKQAVREVVKNYTTVLATEVAQMQASRDEADTD